MGFYNLLKTFHIIAVTAGGLHINRNTSLVFADKVENHLVEFRTMVTRVTFSDGDGIELSFRTLF